VRIPLPVSDQTRQDARQQVINQLVHVYPEGTFLALFDLKSNQPTAHVHKAIRQARLLGLFGWFANDRCCRCEMEGDTPTDCDCFESSGKWCKLTDQGLCMGASDLCQGTKKA
jgi:hypothetical protein